MSFYQDNKEKIALGMFGEETIRNILKENGIYFLQADTIFYLNNKWCLGEIKYQEIFEPGYNFKYYGHGLPAWQVRARLKLYEDTGIHPFLFILEKSEKHQQYAHKTIYYNSLVEIEKNCKGKEGTAYIDTKGKKKRRVYNIDNFHILKHQEKLKENLLKILEVTDENKSKITNR